MMAEHWGIAQMERKEREFLNLQFYNLLYKRTNWKKNDGK